MNSTNLSQEYIRRINRVVDYIDQHLDKNMSLNELADVACFSPFHFHRIFHAMMGEPLSQFIQRLRLEKAASRLLANRNIPVTQIALECGFSGSATFARAFKEAYKMSASEWRKSDMNPESKSGKTDSNDRKTIRKDRKEFDISSWYIDSVTQQSTWRITMQSSQSLNYEVKVKDWPETSLAYVRHVGPYKGDEQLFGRLFDKLFKWAGARGLLRFPETQVLSVYHDNPEITAEDKLRTSICITVPADTVVDGEIGKMGMPAGKYAMARFEINVDQYQAAWDAVCGDWLPNSGFQPADGLSFELMVNNPQEHPEHKHIIDICIPVKPL